MKKDNISIETKIQNLIDGGGVYGIDKESELGFIYALQRLKYNEKYLLRYIDLLKGIVNEEIDVGECDFNKIIIKIWEVPALFLFFGIKYSEKIKPITDLDYRFIDLSNVTRDLIVKFHERDSNLTK